MNNMDMNSKDIRKISDSDIMKIPRDMIKIIFFEGEVPEILLKAREIAVNR